MSKRTAEENAAGPGDHIAPVSAIRRTTPDHQHDGYNLTKKPFLATNDQRYSHKRRFSLLPPHAPQLHQQQHHHQQLQKQQQQHQQQHSDEPLVLDARLGNKKQYNYECASMDDELVNLSNKADSPTSDLHKKELAHKQADVCHSGGGSNNGGSGDELSGNSCEPASKHLVKSLSDLPTFVTIEGFRVASYNIDGEPHLCLPNLLHFIQQKYPIEKAVDIFEETVTNFVSATPKQVEGFVKAIVLPADAKSCPLIRRSDADRICLALFDQCPSATIGKTAARGEPPKSLGANIGNKGKRDENQCHGATGAYPSLPSAAAAAATAPITPTGAREATDKIARSDCRTKGEEIVSGEHKDGPAAAAATISGRNKQLINNFSGSKEVGGGGARDDANDHAGNGNDDHDDNDKHSDKCIQELSSDCDALRKPAHITGDLKAEPSLMENNWRVSRLSPGRAGERANEKLSLSLDSDDLTSAQDDEEEEREEDGVGEQEGARADEGAKQRPRHEEDETRNDTARLDQRAQASSRERLFEMEAQPTILNLARAATSTLIIHVYHRCFGKCNGYYYPSLSKNSESESIECASCHRLLSPRRFIGHTHGAKETNICHWGFNSYNWRHYIHLSRRQTLNKLDDDELIVQLETLKSARDAEDLDEAKDEKVDDSQCEPDRLKPAPVRGRELAGNLNCQIRGSVDQSLAARHPSVPVVAVGAQREAPRVVSAHRESTNVRTAGVASVSPSVVEVEPVARPSTSKSFSDRTEMQPWLESNMPGLSSRRNTCHWPSLDQMLGDTLRPLLEGHYPTGSNSKPLIGAQSGLNLAFYPTYEHSLAAAAAAAAAANAAAAAAAAAALPCGPLNASTATPRPPLSTSYSNLNELMIAPSTNIPNPHSQPPLDGRAISHNRMLSPAPSPSPSPGSNLNNQSLSLATERLIKQDIFVSSGLTNYLNCRGLPSDLVKAIVESTLDLVHKSRVLY